MKRLIGIAALAILAQGAAANDVLYCTDEKGAGLIPEQGLRATSFLQTRFKLQLDGLTAVVAGKTNMA